MKTQIRSFSSRIVVSLILLLSLLSANAFQETYQVSADSEETLFVTFIDVGQGDSSLLSTSSGFDILIDGGPSGAGETVLSYLNAHIIGDLDVIIISHQDADHIGGLLDVLQSSISVTSVLYNGRACETATCTSVFTEIGNRGITPEAVSAGDTRIWGDITASILNPQTVPFDDNNEDSVVVNIAFLGSTLLFTGDIESLGEAALVANDVLSPVDVLKVAHHGSDTSSSIAFLNEVVPQHAVISVGEDNPYGHPSEEVITRLENIGAIVYRTDIDGNVTFTFNESEPPDAYLTYLPLHLKTLGTVTNPDPVPGENIQCDLIGNVEICASVSDATPPRYSNVTVYGRLVINNIPQSGMAMQSTWHYKTTTAYCDSGVTGTGGVASCQRSIGGASAGYEVVIDVNIGGYSISTSFTPTE